MIKENMSIKLKGHESFYIREGWLTKGIKNVKVNPSAFTDTNATEVLGVGNNMVKSIRYWLKASGLTEEKKVKGGKLEQFLTEDFGKIIYKNDRYFEHIFTLWLIHYKIASNKELATSWYLFFNDILSSEFSKDEMKSEMIYSMNRLTNNAIYSGKSLYDDCECILKTYYNEKKEDTDPEDNKICPLSELGLLYISKNDSNQEIIHKTKPTIDKLDKLVVLYIIRDNLANENSTTIDKILNDNCNVGRILNCNRNLLNDYLDQLQNDGYLKIIRTAGLDQVELKNVEKVNILNEYYGQFSKDKEEKEEE